MSDERKPSSDDTQNQQIRQNLVNTAVNFLLNPSVINKPYEHKAAFLRKKGLIEAEISLAYEKAESDPKYKQIKNSSISSNPRVLPPPVPVYSRSVSFWSKLSRFSSSLIVLGVAVYGAHYIYKKYIEPFIFGEDNNGKSQKLEKQLLEMMNSISQLEKHVSGLEESINSQKVQMDRFLQNEVSEYYPTPLALRELKTEIASVKSLLLNRHQFPALPKVTPPTIPQWQLPSKKDDDDDDTMKQNGETGENQHSDEDNSVINPSHELNSENHCNATNHADGTDEVIENLEVKSSQHEFSEELNDVSPVS